jgi:signal transduction histidine kinase
VFSVTYAALDFTDPSRNRYQYKMEGYDDHWVDAGTRREAFYTNLDPGTYTFLVRASNNDNVWSDTPLAVEITIVPPFWMTWWFRGILVVAIIGAGGATLRYLELRKIKRRLERVEQERALERERARISRDMHDDLGANLTSLSMLAEIARMSLDDREKTDAQLQRITSLSTDVVRSLDEIVWAVNPRADHLGNLTAYLSEFAQEFLSSSQIRIRFDFASSLPDAALSSEQRHNIFLVVKEALTNVVKHASASEARLSLGMSGDVLWIEVQDNGTGTGKREKTSPGNGVRNMQQRMESIGGRFSMRNVEPSGVVVRLEVPIRPV